MRTRWAPYGLARALPCLLALALPCLLALALLGGCAPDGGGALDPGSDSGGGSTGAARTGAAPWFEEVARERGLAFEHRSGHAADFLFPEIMGGGAALFDLDADGDLDAYLVQSGSLVEPPESRPSNRLFQNDGEGRFSDVTDQSGQNGEAGAGDRGYGMGVAVGDVDGDGLAELYVTNVGANALLSNRTEGGRLRFADVTSDAGVGDTSWSTSAGFVDYDADGDLDLYVVNYLRWSIADELHCQMPPYGFDYCNPNNYDAPAPDTLYRNEGDGRFVDVSSDAGLRTAFGNGLGIVCADFDTDGWTDVFVANDGMLNQLWMNVGGQRFEDRAVVAGCALDQNGQTKAGMGVSVADVDDDGDRDLFVVNLAGQSDSFYRNEGRHFTDRTALAGIALISRPFTRFGIGLVDFDNDGLLDQYLANGRVTHPTERPGPDPYAEENLLLRGVRGTRFEEVSPRGGTAAALVATSRAAAFGDVDGDGGVDVVVVNRDGPAYLLLNVVAERGRWVSFRVVEAGGRDAYGAVLSVELEGRTLTREVRSAFSYCAASDARVHLGLGARDALRGVRVRWVDGVEESFELARAEGAVELARGSGR